MGRTVRRMIGFLGLGAILTVAVAWGCAYWVENTQPQESIAFGYVTRQPARFGSFKRDRFLGRGRDWRQSLSEYPPTYAREEEKRKSYHVTREDVYVLTEDQRGWPLVSMQSLFCRANPGIPALDSRWWFVECVDGFIVGGDPKRNPYRCVTLPLAPIWPGFMIDVVCYASASWLLFSGAVALQRRSRMRKGKCPLCRYDLRGIVDGGCPECGWGREAVESTSP